MTIDHNIDVQSVFSWAPWAPKVARKCESKHWYACGADGRSRERAVYGHVITKFSRMDSLPHFLTQGAPQARFARQSSAIKVVATKSPFLRVNRSPIRFGFRAGAKSIQYSMNIAF